MWSFLVLLSAVALTSGQYDYTPPSRPLAVNSPQKDKPTYGPPNHNSGVPLGPGESPESAPRPQEQEQQVNQQQPQQQQYQQQPQQQQYQQQPQQQQYQPQQQQYEEQSRPEQQQGTATGSEENYVPKVFKHVYVHVAKDEEPEVRSNVIKVPGGDKHVNIIFVKTPSQSSSSQTEVILPEQDEHKNLVYVLLKKGENNADIKIRKPAPTRQQKPDVYFIRYKDQAQSAPQPQGYQPQNGPVRSPSNGGGNGGYQQQTGVPAPTPVRAPSNGGGFGGNGGYQQTARPAPSNGGGFGGNGGYQQTARPAPSPIRVTNNGGGYDGNNGGNANLGVGGQRQPPTGPSSNNFGGYDL